MQNVATNGEVSETDYLVERWREVKGDARTTARPSKNEGSVAGAVK